MERALRESADDFLFQATITNSDALPIPFNVARGYLPYNDLIEELLQVTDPTNQLWSVLDDGTPELTYIPFDDERSFIVVGNWAAYRAKFRLCPGDKILFFMPKQRLSETHFRTFHVRRPDDAPVLQVYIPEFVRDPFFLFEEVITEGGEQGKTLTVEYDWGRSYFPDLRPGSWLNGHSREMVKFTDYRGKEWYMMMGYGVQSDAYMLMNGWRWFKREYGLETGDLVRFYVPNIPTTNQKHFLIEFEKRRQDPPSPDIA